MRSRPPVPVATSLATLRAASAIFVDASGTIIGGSPLSGGLTLYPDTSRILQGFRARKCGSRKIKTGLITNWGRRVHQTLSHLDIASAFDVVVCADDVPEGKPHPGMFQHAAVLANANPSDCMHIGDSLWDDALGAMGAGWQGVWLARDGRVGSREREHFSQLQVAPSVVGSLDELWDALESHK